MNTDEVLDVSDIPPAELLVALYNGTSVQGMGFMQRRSAPLTVADAEKLLAGDEVETDYVMRKERADLRKQTKKAYFDYLYGKPMKVEINGKTLRTGLYDRDTYDGAAREIVERLREKLGAKA